jgi:cyanophycinase
MTQESSPAVQAQRGRLLLIGGAEDKIGSRTILNRFVELAGGDEARIAVIATASAFHDMVGKRYVDLFREMGVARADVLHLHTRQDALLPERASQIEAMSGIFITGGDQLKLTATLGGTPVSRSMLHHYRAGCVVAGTSAGASVAAEHMLAYGSSGIPPRKAMMQFAPGFGLVSGVVIDQHFGARGRAGRLMTAVAHNPDLLGLGLDEDTAIDIDNDGWLTVLGQGSVMVVDGSDISHTDIHLVAEKAPLTIFDLRLHTLSAGYGYHIHTRTPRQPAEVGPLLAEAEPLHTNDDT